MLKIEFPSPSAPALGCGTYHKSRTEINMKEAFFILIRPKSSSRQAHNEMFHPSLSGAGGGFRYRFHVLRLLLRNLARFRSRSHTVAGVCRQADGEVERNHHNIFMIRVIHWTGM